MSHYNKATINKESFSLYQMVTPKMDYQQTYPFKDDLPDDTPDENYLFTSDIEEIVDQDELYLILSFNSYIFYSRVIVFGYKEQCNPQVMPNIVLPPPKQ